jgi:hypothetical protein
MLKGAKCKVAHVEFVLLRFSAILNVFSFEDLKRLNKNQHFV